MDEFTKAEIDSASKMLYPDKRTFKSLLMKYIPKELCIELHKLTINYSTDNNTKANEIERLLKQFSVPATILGSGTNRMGAKIGGYCFKIAFDEAGCIDNKREFIYSKELQPYVVKTYECFPTGLISVCEYVRGFELDDISSSANGYRNRKEMKKILDIISETFLVGDVGISTKNYGNWGQRADGTLCILDFAYIYSINYKQMECSCGGKLYYDNDYIFLHCQECNKKYTFGQVRKKITREDEKNEIGDITKKGYIIHSESEEKEFNPRFVVNGMDKISEYIRKERKKALKKREQEAFRKSNGNNYDAYKGMSLDDVISKYAEQKNK